MFRGCYSLNEIDLSNFNTQNLENIKQMFYDCSNLNKIDISSFTSINLDYKELFNGNISYNGTIEINKDIYDDIKEYVPESWEIIY